MHKRLRYPFDVLLTHLAFPLGLRHLEDMMTERGVSVDYAPKDVPVVDSTVHRWAIKLLPVLEKAFRRRKRPVGESWRTGETYTRHGSFVFTSNVDGHFRRAGFD
ncbi:UNVERIFIED_ORG: transposase-like protein [Paraburkholderia sediminicola]|nr:transposase-like protein [Paraburkholderia sediminicola]